MSALSLSFLVHMTEEARNSIDKRVCFECGSDKTKMHIGNKQKDGTRKPYPEWRRDSLGHWICRRCYQQIINPIYNPIYSNIHNPRRLTYKGKVIRMKNARRIGVCNWCRAVTPFDCAKTELHHEQYDDNNPLAHTIEICPRCHIKTKNFDTEKNRAALEYRRKHWNKKH